MLCGKILADIGVEVIKVERPGGDTSRRIGPFYHNIPDYEKSLYWFAFNTGKKGITLNLETTTGYELFIELVKSSDFVLESFPPGYMGKLGLDYKTLSQINPRIILTSITPFGQNGPYKQYKTTDIVISALSGFMFTAGDSDRPPIRISVPQAHIHAGLHAAAATLAAHHHREKSGEGQYVDVSSVEANTYASFPSRVCWDCAGIIIKRSGNRRRLSSGPYLRTLWPCKDGYILFGLAGGPAFGGMVGQLVEWMDKENMAGELTNVDWCSVSMTDLSQDEINRWERTFEQFFATHTKAEIEEEANKRKIVLGKVNTTADTIDDPQLKFREFFIELEHPELGESIKYPGIPFKSTAPLGEIIRRAPLIGEHNTEIYENELGLQKNDISALKKANII